MSRPVVHGRSARVQVSGCGASPAVVATIAATMLATPVLADFFIVREGVSGPCLVVDARPTDAKTVVIGNKVYTARADAERDIPNLCPTAAPAVEGQVVAPPAPVIVVPPTVQAPVVAPPQEFRPRLLRSRLSQPRFLLPRASIKVGPSQTAQQIQWAKPAIRALGDKLGFFFGLAVFPCRVLHGRKDDLSACRTSSKNEALHYLTDHPLTEDERANTGVGIMERPD
jgi:hypothetical protein